MKAKIYVYDKCSTCRQALRHLEKLKIPYEAIPIVETPPTKAELSKMLALYGHELKKLFNTSGQMYRELKISEKLAKMSGSDAIDLLSRNGKLIKRPFLLLGEKNGRVGFKEDDWRF